jgi:hypothetical protein
MPLWHMVLASLRVGKDRDGQKLLALGILPRPCEWGTGSLSPSSCGMLNTLGTDLTEQDDGRRKENANQSKL